MDTAESDYIMIIPPPHIWLYCQEHTGVGMCALMTMYRYMYMHMYMYMVMYVQ